MAAADPVDISGMPDPATVGLAPDDPTNGMPEPKDLYRKAMGHDALSPADVDEFMRNPPNQGRPLSARQNLSALSGIPRAAAGYAAAVPAGVASIVGQGVGALGAALDPENAAEHLGQGRERGREWSAKVNNLANYVPATKQGAKFAEGAMALPGNLIGEVSDASLGKVLPDNAYQAVKDVAQDVGTDLPALGAPGVVRGAIKGTKGAYGAIKDSIKTGTAPEGVTYDSAGNAQAPSRTVTPPVGSPITGDTLRAQPNPIPPPEGTAAAAKAPTVPAETPPAAPTQASAQEPTAQPQAPTGPVTPAERHAANRALEALDAQRGSVRLFNEPAKEGPQETPTPEKQGERAGHLDAINQLSGGQLPKVRGSALSGDYNATGDDFQAKEVGSPTMRAQIASENHALHTAAENVHGSIGSEFENSVDSTTLGDRGRVTRGAIQGIEKHFEDATDGIYNVAREQNQGRPIPKLQRVSDYLNDDSNFTNDAEIGLQRAAKQRMDRLWSTGDPDKGAPPGSVNAAERLREFLNEKGKNPQAMGVAGDLKGHLDMDVAEHGGPGLFEAARAMRRHKYQMLEEPTGIKKLLTPGDSQGINHAIPEHKVMDYIADLPREQHEHVLNVLRAGAHLGEGDLANSSAAALKEIQAHVISRMHDAARNADGTWNARKFYNAADRYGRNAPETFKERPDVLKNLKTINDAGNTLNMDKHYPGAAAQTERTGLGTRALEMGGNMAASLVHEVPVVGRFAGRAIEKGVEKTTNKMGEESREKAVASRLIDNGKQRGSVGVLPQRDAVEHATSKYDENGNILHHYKVPGKGGGLVATEYPERNITQVHLSNVNDNLKGQGWGTRMLQRAADDAHARGQVLHSDQQVSEGQVGAYKNLSQLGYNIKMRDNDVHGGARHAVGDHVFEVRPGVKVPESQRGSVRVTKSEDGSGSLLNVGLHQGQEGEKGFRKMSKQEAQGAIESTGAKVTKASVLTPKRHGVAEPTLVASTDRPITDNEMRGVLAKTKQSAIPQRTDQGDESMHVAPGHEEIAKKEGWSQFNPDYFREHSGQTATDVAANPKNIHPGSTVTDPKRSAYPGIYDDPKDIMSRLKTTDESPHLKEIFGTTRKAMHDEVIARGDVEPKTPMPGMTKGGKGSAAAQQVTTPENAERIRNTITALKEHDPDAYHGMVAWYHMDPMYQSIKKIVGNDKQAGDIYHKLNTYTALASPMSSVGPEITRGTAAATMAAEGKFSQFAEHGGNPTAKSALKKAPELKNQEMGMEGHAFHSTAQAPAMSRFNETGQEADAPKTGAYRRASDAPSRPGSEYQNTVLVGDSHFSRGAGLADVRDNKQFASSIEGPELKTVHPWYHENVAKPLGIPATSAQAAQWATLSHETGVETPIGQPKLEIWADQIADAAKRAGVTPKEMWRRIVKRLAT